MSQFRTLCAALAIGGAIFSPSASAQYGSSSSLTHGVSVTIPPRIKVRLSPVSLTSSQSVSPAVKLTTRQAGAEGLALSVHATQRWVLSIKSTASSRTAKPQWSSVPRGAFSAITSADTVVATGGPSTPRVDTAMFFRSGQRSGGSAGPDDAAVVLTVSAP
jgi:hypothetical protein